VENHKKKQKINIFFYRSYSFRSYALTLPVTFSEVLIVDIRECNITEAESAGMRVSRGEAYN
jgi:hypothetical protein